MDLVYNDLYWAESSKGSKVELGISSTNANSQQNPVYKAFIEFVVLETKQVVSSNGNVILTR